MLDRQTGRIDSLTGARFAAIMIIVFSHFTHLCKYGEFGLIYKDFFINPTMGVDYFFMLSGFGMMLSSIRKDATGVLPVGGIKGMISFGRNHIKKIYPVYVAFLVLGSPITIFQIFQETGSSLFRGIKECALYFSVDLTLLQSATGKHSISHSINGVCWFLSSLFCIYLISPVILRFLKEYVKSINLAFIGIIISITVSVILAYLFNWIENKTFFDELCYASPYRRAFYVIPGMILAQLFVIANNNSSSNKALFFEKGIFEYICMCSSMIWFFLRNLTVGYFGQFVYIIDMVIVCCDLYALAIGKGIFSRFFSSKIMVYLGNISMYLFISHYIIIKYVDFSFRKLGFESIQSGLVEVVVILALSFIISIIINCFRKKKLCD